MLCMLIVFCKWPSALVEEEVYLQGSLVHLEGNIVLAHAVVEGSKLVTHGADVGMFTAVERRVHLARLEVALLSLLEPAFMEVLVALPGGALCGLEGVWGDGHEGTDNVKVSGGKEYMWWDAAGGRGAVVISEMLPQRSRKGARESLRRFERRKMGIWGQQWRDGYRFLVAVEGLQKRQGQHECK